MKAVGNPIGLLLQFKNKQVVYVNQDGILLKTFDVVFNDATKIEFDGKGQWKEVDMNTQAVPEFFIPASIQNYVKANYPGTIITCIDVERGLKEIKLSNGLELKFNSWDQLIEIDD